MKRKFPYHFFYVLAAIFFVAWLFVTIQVVNNFAGWLLLFFFFSLAMAFRGNQFTKGLSFTALIIGVVSLSMYHPQYFKTVGSFKLTVLIIPLLQVIMFGMGTELSL